METDTNGLAGKVAVKRLTANGRNGGFQYIEEQTGYPKKHKLRFHSIKRSLHVCTGSDIITADNDKCTGIYS